MSSNNNVKKLLIICKIDNHWENLLNLPPGLGRLKSIQSKCRQNTVRIADVV